MTGITLKKYFFYHYLQLFSLQMRGRLWNFSTPLDMCIPYGPFRFCNLIFVA
jgi:hypothetical protein